MTYQRLPRAKRKMPALRAARYSDFRANTKKKAFENYNNYYGIKERKAMKHTKKKSNTEQRYKEREPPKRRQVYGAILGSRYTW